MLSKIYSLAITASLLISSNALAAPKDIDSNAARSVTPSFPCYNFADPDNGVGNYCMCYNGASTPVAQSTGTNTGTNYQPCPYTSAPPTPTKAPKPRAFARSTEDFRNLANTTTTTTATPLPCYNFADPDNDVGDFCMCSNGISTPIASETGTNTGTNYQPCPYTVAPTSQVSSVSTFEPPTTESTASCTEEARAVIRTREPLASITKG